MQRWRFLVIRDAKIKEAVGAYYKRAWDEQVAPRYRSGEPAPGMSQERFLRLLDAAEYLANHIHEAPVGGEAGVFDNGLRRLRIFGQRDKLRLSGPKRGRDKWA